jgi:hypothetical protein
LNTAPAGRISRASPSTPALRQLDGVTRLLTAGTHSPVAFFAYLDRPGLLTPDAAANLTLADLHEDADGPAGREALVGGTASTDIVLHLLAAGERLFSSELNATTDPEMSWSLDGGHLCAPALGSSQ